MESSVLLKSKPIITAEMERRRKIVRRSFADSRIEGMQSDPATRPIFDAYVRGEIDISDILPRVKALML